MRETTPTGPASQVIAKNLRWLALALLLFLFVGIQQWMSRTPTERKRIRLDRTATGEPTDIRQCTMIPGRVVELHTTRGEIDFVLFEKDCPRTTARIAELASKGCYDKLTFPRVEKAGLIQTDQCKQAAPPMPCEILKGLTNGKGAVGMARTSNPNSATSVFYILMEPWHHLDYEYTVFGRVIKGMDVAMKIRKGDVIDRACVRALTAEDQKLFHKVLQIEAERKTE